MKKITLHILQIFGILLLCVAPILRSEANPPSIGFCYSSAGFATHTQAYVGSAATQAQAQQAQKFAQTEPPLPQTIKNCKTPCLVLNSSSPPWKFWHITVNGGSLCSGPSQFTCAIGLGCFLQD